jgi:hypothetical protein
MVWGKWHGHSQTESQQSNFVSSEIQVIADQFIKGNKKQKDGWQGCNKK